MTRGELKQLVRDNLGSGGSSFYSDAEIEDSIQDSYAQIVGDFQLLASSTTITVPANKNFLDVKALVPDYLSAISFYDPIRKVYLNDSIKWPLGFSKIDPQWQTRIRPPEAWDFVDARTIAFFGRQPTTYNLTLRYFQTAPVLTADNDTINVPTIVQPALETWIYGTLKEQFEEFQAATLHWREFETLKVTLSSVLSEYAAKIMKGFF